MSTADRSRKSVFTSTGQTGDAGLQASSKLFTLTLDARTLLLKVGPALIGRLANLKELRKC